MGPNGSKDIEVELDQMKKKIALYHSNETWLDESIDLMQVANPFYYLLIRPYLPPLASFQQQPPVFHPTTFSFSGRQLAPPRFSTQIPNPLCIQAPFVLPLVRESFAIVDHPFFQRRHVASPT